MLSGAGDDDSFPVSAETPAPTNHTLKLQQATINFNLNETRSSNSALAASTLRISTFASASRDYESMLKAFSEQSLPRGSEFPNFLTYLMSFTTRSDKASKCINNNKHRTQQMENKFYIILHTAARTNEQQRAFSSNLISTAALAHFLHVRACKVLEFEISHPLNPQ